MVASVLQHVTLGYQLLWNAKRQVAGVVLSLHALPDSAFDAEHLLGALSGLWHANAPKLVLSTDSPALLANLLDLTPPGLAQVDVPASLLSDPAIGQRVLGAHQRGLPMVWRGQPGQYPLPAFAACFTEKLFSLTTEETLAALRVSLRRLNAADQTQGLNTTSPVRARQLYDTVASRVLAEHCLDEQGVTALLGWPMEDVLYGYRQARIQPGHQAINTLISSIDSDASMAEIEHHLSQEPLLAYRLLRYLNSAGLGLTREIDSLRQGLMVLGLSRTKNWLQDLLPNASHDPNLRPVRTAMVLRASFMAELLDAGESDALQRELYLCGLLSQIDLLLGESMAVALRTVPLPGRIKDAIVTQTGPYWPFLDVAMSLETPHPQATLARCAQHSFDLEEVNLALLHTLAELPKV